MPQLGPTYLIMSGPQSKAEFHFDVEVVADDVPPFKRTFAIKVPLGKGLIPQSMAQSEP